MLVAHNCLVLVADGGSYTLYRNRGHGLAVELETLVTENQKVPDTADLGTDRPGRSFSSSGSRRSNYQAPDYHQRAEDEFMKKAAAMVTERFGKAPDATLVIVAAPKSMSALRKAFGDAVRSRIIAEIAKDYADRPSADIEELLVRS